MPLTPVSSTEIKGQDGTHQLSAMQMSFELPPSAMSRGTNSSLAAETPARNTPAKMPYPVQASEVVKSRRRSSAAQKDTFALPPPPTRSRKIIQMKPRTEDAVPDPSVATKTPPATAAAKGAAGAAAATTTTPPTVAASPASSSKKKQPSATSAAGRKIARKTAHSLIERRRRSKMNEEFAVLKDMIPACTGEMHKLAILQASIEYVRYLEDCIAQLKAQTDANASTPTDFALLPPPAGRESGDEDEAGDVEMAGSEAPSPSVTPSTSRSLRPSESPALLAEDARRRHNSHSSVSSDQHRYSYSASSHPSPAFGPQQPFHAHPGLLSSSSSTVTSPALPPQRDLDQEASAALLMLNTDRRGTHSSILSARGLSVKDLLSA